MIDGVSLSWIGIAVLVCTIVITIISSLFAKTVTLPMSILISGMVIGFTFGFYGMQQMGIESEAKLAQEKAQIDLLSCSDLGKYLVTNPLNKTGNYDYVQSKYLVCTHTPGVP